MAPTRSFNEYTHIVLVPRGRPLCERRFGVRLIPNPSAHASGLEIARTSDEATCPLCRRLRGLDPVDADGLTAEALARYEVKRADAIERLESLGVESLPLDVAAAMLPEHPEWAAYGPKKGVR